MAEDRNEVRHVNWQDLFAFTSIFKSFKMASHLSKLALAVAAISLIWLFGKGLSWTWTLSDTNGYEPTANAIVLYAADPANYDSQRNALRDSRPDRAAKVLNEARREKTNHQAFFNLVGERVNEGYFTNALKLKRDEYKSDSDAINKKAKDDFGNALSEACDDASEANDSADKEVDNAYTAASDSIKNRTELKVDGEVVAVKTDAEQDSQYKKLDSDYLIAKKAVTDNRIAFNEAIADVRGQKIFETFGSHEAVCINNAMNAVFNGNFTRGATNPTQTAEADRGFLAWMSLAFSGIGWLALNHWLFAAIFLLASLAIWAFFGGAIYRIAALHFARDEKMSIVQGLKFACGKWLSFFTAPLLPVAFIVALGMLIALGSLLNNIPGAGPIIVGVLLMLALLLGLAIAFIAIGLIAGFNLMYPTIAVEGSDSFDAISRSFAYVFGRPWSAALYGVVAVVYGAICYLFVRLFAYIALYATYTFMQVGTWAGGQSLGAADKMPIIWNPPTFWSLHNTPVWAAAGGGETVGAAFIWVWVALIATVVGGFLLSYLASSTTVIYFLLRRKVDATDLDDVYVQEAPAEPAPAAPAAPAASENTVVATPVTQEAAAPAAPKDAPQA